MADDKSKADIEKEKFIKSTGTKLLELLLKISPAPTGVKEVYKISKETTKALTATSADSGGGYSIKMLMSDNILQLITISERMLDEASRLDALDVNWWIVTSGVNLFSRGDLTKAIVILDKQRQVIVGLRDGCDGLKALTVIVLGASITDVKSLAKVYITDFTQADAAGSKEARENFADCQKKFDSILTTLDLATRAVADMNKLVDRFMVLKTAQDQREATKVILKSGAGSAPAAPKN